MTEAKAPRPPRILSGIQPSGNLTIGNYLGALKQWAQLQDQYDSFYCIVDLHAITVQQDPAALREGTRRNAALFLACGLDTKYSTVFVQSHVPAHSELSWILGTFTPMGWLNRMTQFKDKAAKLQADSVGSGLFTYPVLMAADILIYHANLVPVGDDQRQHIELTRDLAQRFNSLYGETFTIPSGFIPKAGARIMGLDNPLMKMSKSEASENHAVYLLDPPDKARKKIMRAVTDSGSGIYFSTDDEKAGVNNLLGIYQAFTGESSEAIEAHFAGKGYGDLKKAVAEVVVEGLRSIQAKYEALTGEGGYIDEVLKQGADRANEVAGQTLKHVKERVGFLPPLAAT
ncbi:MAG TPA: tryptophan--tRNA ligase [Aggregatilineales bacterium]|nr:tryptophan--tRNA ligase [Anaerolineales bacterium]HRE47046.1 tryptophan--tRNA ligase [Aggregatilineales bacterium]